MSPRQRVRAALLVLLTVAACSVVARRSAAPVEGVVIPVREGFVTADDGAQLFYRVVGDGPDTVVAVHGGPGLHMGSLVSFEPLAPGGTVIFYDQRGGGKSSLPEDASQVTDAWHVSDLDAMLRHFRIEAATLLGHSWGGLLVGMYAAEHRERVARMILVSPMFLRSTPYARQYAASLPTLLGADTARFRTLYAMWDTTSSPHAVCRELVPITMRAGGTTDTAAVQRVTEGICSPGVHPEALRRGWTRTPEWTMQSLGSWDVRERLRRVRAEALVIHGDRDAVPSAATQEWVTTLPRARRVTFPAAGHYIYAEDPPGFARVVREFLGRD